MEADKSKEPKIDDNKEQGETIANVRLITIVFLPLIFIMFSIWFFIFSPETIQCIIEEHFRAITGIPIAFITSLFLVLLLKQEAKGIVFKCLSFEFSGLAGEVILWAICFLAIVHAMEILWI